MWLALNFSLDHSRALRLVMAQFLFSVTKSNMAATELLRRPVETGWRFLIRQGVMPIIDLNYSKAAPD